MKKISKYFISVGVLLIQLCVVSACKKDLQPAESTKEVVQIREKYFLRADGTVWEIGSKNRASTPYTGTNSPIQIANNTKKIEESATCLYLLKNDNSLWVKGLNTYGEFGLATPANSSTFIRVTTNVKDVDCKAYSLMVLKNDNTLWTAGYNNFGQLGDGTTTNKNTLTRIDNNVSLIASGIHHCLYMKTDSTIWAMGKNDRGQLANGTTINANRPTRVTIPLRGVKLIKSDFFGVSHFLTTTNELWITNMSSLVSRVKDNVKDFEYSGTDAEIAYKILDNNGLLFTYFNNAVQNIIGYDVKEFYKNKVILEDNEIWGFGSNFQGRLGDEDEERNFPLFKKISNAITEINYGNNRLYYIKNNKLYESNESFSSFSEVMTQVNRIFSCPTHVLIIKNDNSLWGKGLNNRGQLGNGNTTAQTSFIKIADNVLKASINDSNMVYVTHSRDVFICGANRYGQCGISPSTSSVVTSPVLANPLAIDKTTAASVGLCKVFMGRRFKGFILDINEPLGRPDSVLYSIELLGLKTNSNFPVSFDGNIEEIKCANNHIQYNMYPIYLARRPDASGTTSMYHVDFNYHPAYGNNDFYPSLAMPLDNNILYYFPVSTYPSLTMKVIYQKTMDTKIHVVEYQHPIPITINSQLPVIPTINLVEYNPDFVEKIAVIDHNNVFFLSYDNKIYRYTLGGTKTFVTQ